MANPTDRQRARYRALLDLTDRPFDLERPAVFSPAAAAQDAANDKGLLFRWTPIHIPYEYTSWVEESLAHVQSCYIGDWTPIGKLRVSGSDALTALAHIGMNDLSRFELGQVKHHVQLDEHGYVASEGVLYRVAEEEFVYTGGGVDWTAWQLDQHSPSSMAEPAQRSTSPAHTTAPESTSRCAPPPRWARSCCRLA